jgi:hypothetical protein
VSCSQANPSPGWRCGGLVWAAFLAALVASSAAAGETGPDLRACVERNHYRQAYGVYTEQRKIGWAVDELKLDQRDGQEVAVSTFELKLRFLSGGEECSMESKAVTYYELAGAGEMIRAEEEDLLDKNLTKTVAVREGRQMAISIRSQGAESKRRAPLPKQSLGLIARRQAWFRQGPPKGASLADYETEWDQEDIDKRELYTVQGHKTILWGGVKTRVFTVTIRTLGVLVTAEVNADGILVKGKFGGLFELRADKETTARQLEGELTDLLATSFLKADKDLGEPAQITALTLELRGAEQLAIPTSHRQRVARASGKKVLVELWRDRRAETAEPLSPAQREQFLKATATVQADHEVIRKLAREVAGGATNVVEQATRLEHWIYEHISQKMAANASSAVAVLNNRAGDCTELTLLFLALARSLGIPTREVGGIVFLNAEEPIFGWHAWAEVHDGHQWVSVDPTWDQVYVDATHLKLSEGSEDLAWLNVLGKLTIHIVKFKR